MPFAQPEIELFVGRTNAGGPGLPHPSKAQNTAASHGRIAFVALSQPPPPASQLFW
jgi:hypothetical protein